MQYRAEIDGLRALAVVPVVFFHAGFDTFSGGFVGVDVFFVISGYLITTILIEDIENQRFSILKFYERRARRILPALFFMMMCCIPFAWMWMLPSQMKDFSQAIIAVSLFASNILFWRESGYFAADSEENPLLHTWSLAVEEQYYLLFPVFLLLTWRFGRNSVFWILAACAVTSLVASEWVGRNYPSANFYFAPTRAWEILAGSLSAFVVRRNGSKKNDAIALLGLAAILFSIFYFDETTPIPSVYALVPVAGTVLLLLYATSGTYVAKLLSTKVCVGLGLISYSVYLWHQPLFAFARIRLLTEPSAEIMLTLSVLSIILGALSWRFIERPFRGTYAVIGSQSQIFRVGVVASSFAILIGLVGFARDGFPSRFEFTELAYGAEDKNACTIMYDFLYHQEKNTQDVNDKLDRKVDGCFSDNNPAKFILIGDSHARNISKALRASIEASGAELVTLLHSGCFLIPGTYQEPAQPSCLAAKEKFWQIAERTDAKIILSSRWRLYFTGLPFDNGEGGIERMKTKRTYVSGDHGTDIIAHSSDQILNLGNTRKVFVLSQIPEAGWNVPHQIFKMYLSGLDQSQLSTSYDVYKERNASVNKWLQSLTNSKNISIVKTENLVCSEVSQRCDNLIESIPLYKDDDHPSIKFAELIASHFVDVAKP